MLDADQEAVTARRLAVACAEAEQRSSVAMLLVALVYSRAMLGVDQEAATARRPAVASAEAEQRSLVAM
ncbi:unnamed protein product [Haemonchus placei]|uniref:ANTAR domain-containing protein n=1 Tax=Haemonchus placei TaxID=6290 RepID=A0A0N4W8Q9_HAEPC|nr:unnamed protein product [Haemonchus placei]